MYAITQDRFGGPEVLYRTEAERPQPGSGEVLVRVRAAGVNPVDSAVRAGHFPLFPTPPFALGWDVAGVVEAVGPGVTRFEVGAEVFGMPLFPKAAGAYAEYLVAPAAELAAKPAALSMSEAGALPLSGLTAWQGLVGLARIEAGQRVLIHAAAGGVGHLAVQVAKARGAHVVGTARAENHAFLTELGADELIDYTATDFTVAIDPVDVVFDLVGGEYAPRSLGALKPGGVLVTTVGHNPGLTSADAERHGVRFETVFVHPSAADLTDLAGLAEAGALRVHVEREFDLIDAAEAHASTGSAKGKTVLIP
ncbi:NADP-dependent oxidoreductase [Nocardia sp. NBC_01009]|uniref:NADP-dependent oxidoreductase n=1 Tax=Nocardia sp. NBC_01009 TaxID=2975996 RepID=UPI0038659A14|nr:NADP-dependent oxidoreductase [Nocardia sp. NBC_01009]